MELSGQEQAFAAEVNRCRLALGLTQDRVAELATLSRSKVSEACGGTYLPSEQVLDKLIIALGMDRERAIKLWKAAHQGRRERQRLLRISREPTPDNWSALPVLPEEVTALLQVQIGFAHELPYKLPGAKRPSLETVYVRQELGSGGDEPRQEQEAEPAPMLDHRGMLLPTPPPPRAAVRPPSRPVREALDGHDHLLVTGGPGQGKSTLLLRLAADIATAWVTGVADGETPITELVIPVRVTARELATQLGVPLPQALASCVLAEYGRRLRAGVGAHLLAGRVGGCRWLLLVDALDEVAGVAKQDQLVSDLAAWVSEPAVSPYRIVLTTRPIEGTTTAPLQRAAVPRYELQPFDEQALRRFADNWFGEHGEDDARRFIRQVREAHLDELVRVPLLATIAAIVFERHDDRPLPDNQYQLYESYLELLRTAHTSAPSQFDHIRAELLEHLGRIRLLADTSLLAAARERVTQRIARERLSPDWQDELTAYLTAAGPMIYRVDDLRFLHHTFAEHLAATADARLLPDAFDPEHDGFAKLLHAALQEERGRHARTVLVHYTHLHESETDELISWLHAGTSEQHLLAARLLAQHVPAGEAVIDTFLATARAWARTTQYRGREILRFVSGAAHHRGLASWLASLMSDETIPWSSRILAATAVATRVHSSATDIATALLRAVVANEELAVTDRVTAAEALADSGADAHDVAKQSLRLLLTEPALPARRHRNAAVLLAAIGDRAQAVAGLSARVDDPETPHFDLVEAATGLTEIGTEFHERSAAIFLQVLRDRAHTMDGRTTAATGLAALGPDHTAEAVAVLNSLIANRHLDRFDRITAAESLAEMGPQHRLAAGQQLMGLLDESGTAPNERRYGADILARLGERFQATAITHLRGVIADRSSMRIVSVSRLAAENLAELGPELHEEAAREFQHLADDPLLPGAENARALGHLAALGGPHREVGVTRLRANMNDRDLAPDDRYSSARELAALGPEFHDEVIPALLEIVSAQPDHDVLIQAWGYLATLRTDFREPASEVIRAELRAFRLHDLPLYLAVTELAKLGPRQRGQAAEILSAAVADVSCGCDVRLNAAGRLADLGSEFQQTAVDAVIQMLRDEHGYQVLDEEPNIFTRVGPAHRMRLNAEVHRLMLSREGTPEQTLRAALALITLGFPETTDVVATLCAVLAAPYVDADDRVEAALALAEIDNGHVPDAITVLRTIATTTRSATDWDTAIDGLIELGQDPVAVARGVLINPNATRELRGAAAIKLAELRPDAADEALGELRQQAADEHLDYWARSSVFMTSTQLDVAAGEPAIEFHRALLLDEGQPANRRCDAARQLVELDRAYWPEATAVVRRILNAPFTSLDDRRYAISVLANLRTLRPNEEERLTLAIVHHPAAPHHTRHRAINSLPQRLAADAQRTLLVDPNVQVAWRVCGFAATTELPIRTEIEASIRDTLDAPESTLTERVDAAMELDDLWPAFANEANERLHHLLFDTEQPSFDVLDTVAGHNDQWRRTIVNRATMIVEDDGLPRRYRLLAACLAVDLVSAEEVPTALAFLRATADDTRESSLHRVESLRRLCEVDGPERLRAMRDDDRMSPHSRIRAAIHLLDYTTADRATAFAVLKGIGSHPAHHPELRRRAADQLTALGAPGRDAALRVLRAILNDSTASVICRAKAATLLATTYPTCALEALAALTELANTENPLHRVQVLRIGASIQDTDATLELSKMARDHTLGPVVRLRSAEELAELRRDHRETSATTARELMHDTHLPRHLRQHAARNLARWSVTCRDEARSILNSLAQQ